MELRHLHYFKTLAEELHFGNAAKKLFISQPPLSRQIKELELELKAELFIRNNKKVELTDAGKYFYAQVDAMISHLEQVKNTTRLIHEQVSGEIRLGYISSTPKQFIANILEDLKITYPLLQVNLIEASSMVQVESLLNGKLDLAIIRGNIPDNNIQMKLLFKDELCVVAPLANTGKFTLDEIKSMDYISFNNEYAPEYFKMSEDLSQKLNFEPKIKHQCNNMNAILELVRLKVGYAIAPFTIVQANKDLTIIKSSEIHKKIESNVYLAYHADNSSMGIAQILDRISNLQK